MLLDGTTTKEIRINKKINYNGPQSWMFFSFLVFSWSLFRKLTLKKKFEFKEAVGTNDLLSQHKSSQVFFQMCCHTFYNAINYSTPISISLSFAIEERLWPFLIIFLYLAIVGYQLHQVRAFWLIKISIIDNFCLVT